MSRYLLTVNGVTKTLEAWGVTSAELSLNSGVGDALSLETTEPLGTVPQWLARQAVTLISQPDGVTRFQGFIVPPKQTARGAGRRKGYRVEGPDWWLKHIIFDQAWAIYGSADSAVYGRVFLYGTSTPRQVITAAIARATTAGAPFVQGTIGDSVFVFPPIAFEDRTCDQVIKDAMRRLIDAVQWWDYSGTGTMGGVPAVNIKRFADCDTLSLSASAGATSGLQVEECYEQTIPFIEIRLRRQNPRKPDGTVAGTGDAIASFTTDHFSRTIYPPTYFADGGLEFGGVDVSMDWDPAFTEIEAATTAAQVYAAANNVRWTGSVEVPGAGPTWALRPGVRLSITGQATAWATMGALVQTVTHDLMRGVTRASFGPPKQLGFADLAEMIKNLHGRRPRPNDLAAQSTGQSGDASFGFDKKDDEHKRPADGAVTYSTSTLLMDPDPMHTIGSIDLPALAIADLGAGGGHVLKTVAVTTTLGVHTLTFTQRTITGTGSVTVTQDGDMITIDGSAASTLPAYPTTGTRYFLDFNVTGAVLSWRPYTTDTVHGCDPSGADDITVLTPG